MHGRIKLISKIGGGGRGRMIIEKRKFSIEGSQGRGRFQQLRMPRLLELK